MNLQDYSNDNDHDSYLIGSNFIATCLSAIGSGLLISDYTKNTSPKTVTRKLILSLALADLLYTIANGFSTLSFLTGDTFCQIEGILRQFSLIMSIAMATSIAIFCFKDAESIAKERFFDQESFYRKAVLWSCVYCFFFAFIPLFASAYIEYRRNETFCWVELHDDKPSKFAISFVLLLFFGAPLIAGGVLTLSSYGRAYFITQRYLGKGLAVESVSMLKRYPTVLFLTFAPCSLANILNRFSGDTSILLEALCIFVTHSVGFFNFLAYRLQKNNVRTEPDAPNQPFIAIN